MSYFYVKSGLGTCTDGTGEFATPKTGAFGSGDLTAGNVYASIGIAINSGGATNGDYILVSDAHAHDGTFGSTSIGYTFPSIAIVCVDDTDVETTSVGTSVMDGYNNNDTWFYGNQYHYGIYWQTGDDMGPFGTTTDYYGERCTYYANGTDDVCMSVAGNGATATLVNCTFHGVSGAIALYASASGSLEVYGGKITGITNGVISGAAINGKGYATINGLDCSTVTGYIVIDGGSALGTDDGFEIELNGCKLNASLTGICEETIVSNSMRVSLFGCAATSAESEYQFYIESRGGVVESIADNDSPTVYRNESTAFPSGRKVSAKCVTTTAITRLSPFYFDLPAKVIDLTSTGKIRIYFASTATLTDNDVWASVVFPDATNKHLGLFASSKAENMLSSGTEYTDDSGSSTWKDASGDLSGYNEYYLEVDTTVIGNGGAKSVPVIRIFVATDATIYFDVTLGASA